VSVKIIHDFEIRITDMLLNLIGR